MKQHLLGSRFFAFATACALIAYAPFWIKAAGLIYAFWVLVVAVLVFYLMKSKAFFFSRIEQEAKRCVQTGDPRGMFAPQTLEIHSQELVFTTEIGQTKLSYAGIVEAYLNKGMLYLYTSSVDVTFVPTAIFADQEELKVFSETINVRDGRSGR